MLTAVLKAVKMLLSCCPNKTVQDAAITALKAVQDAVITALKAVQDAEKNHPHKDQVQRLIPINENRIICVLHRLACEITSNRQISN
jgi:hypothetical protein